ncbi:MAG: nitronate monooxygenase [Planctomycetales bacterium]|nr:nitronate monooxygenase [Planctomycetales bacterium]
MRLPVVIQGGMGVAISHWPLAKAVSAFGQLGVVSGIGIDLILCSRLAEGDPEGHVRRALSHFPFPDLAEQVVSEYFRASGSHEDEVSKLPTLWTATPTIDRVQLGVLAGFMEVFLAKEGHENRVGINLLEKAQLANLSVLYGAMLAGVDVVIVGAGVPMKYPGIIDQLVRHEDVSYPLDVCGASAGQEAHIELRPDEVFPGIANRAGDLRRPMFLPIVSSNALASALVKRANGTIDGFIVEYPIAGGHNAPPRGRGSVSATGEPVYTDKDNVDLDKLKALGLPFWLAGGFGRPGQLQQALASGAAGIQVGTPFAYCDESGMEPALRQRVLDKVRTGSIQVHTDPKASPTGFPFKVVQLDGTASDPLNRVGRERVCDLGMLRQIYAKDDGSLGYRCPAEPVSSYEQKGGDPADTEGVVCLCNSLGATAGYPRQRKNGYVELPLVTAGDMLADVGCFLPAGATHYTAEDVLHALLNSPEHVAAVRIASA